MERASWNITQLGGVDVMVSCFEGAKWSGCVCECVCVCV